MKPKNILFWLSAGNSFGGLTHDDLFTCDINNYCLRGLPWCDILVAGISWCGALFRQALKKPTRSLIFSLRLHIRLKRKWRLLATSTHRASAGRYWTGWECAARNANPCLWSGSVHDWSGRIRPQWTCGASFSQLDYWCLQKSMSNVINFVSPSK